MKQLLSLLSLLVFSFSGLSQTSAEDVFSNSTVSSSWTGGTNNNNNCTSLICLNQPTSGELFVNCSNGTVTSSSGKNYNGFSFNFSSIDVSASPYVSIKVKSAYALNLRIDMIDINGRSTNQSPVVKSITVDGANYYNYLYDFTGKFSTNTEATVLATNISSIIFMTNPGTGFSNYFIMDSVMVGSVAKTNYANFPKTIKLNQLGFFTKGYKKAVVASGLTPATSYYIVSSSNLKDTVYRGSLTVTQNWTYSSEKVQIADFTKFNVPGQYIMLVPGITNSNTFVISDYALNSVAKSSLKGYYFQRASIPIVDPYAGIFTRAEGHPDNHVLIHPSATSYGRPAGTVVSGPKGWYDAGDYNKYVVNAGISTYTLLSAYEHFSPYYDTLNLNIPESGNGIPDILDEVLWEIRWLFTMQDPYDGGVYHKLTNLNFDPIGVMPADATTPRYMVAKSSQAAFDFAAIMAQSARIFSNFSAQLPGLADSCVNAASWAYIWGQAFPTQYYNQAAINKEYPSDSVSTGPYQDGYSGDEQYWAAAELYTTTQNPMYYPSFNTLPSNSDIPGWPNVSTLGLITLSHYRKLLPGISYDTANIMNKITSIAGKYRTYCMNSSAYDVAMGTNSGDFNWGSNSQAGNEAFVMLEAFNYAKDSTYLNSALSNIDYLLGRNAPGICFLTGSGTTFTMHPHHGVSDADGLPNPIPGLLAGGPNANPDLTEGCGPASAYPYSTQYPAFTYLDEDCSYSTNEVAINWNAPLCFCTGALQSLYSGITPFAKPFTALTPLPTSTVSQVNTSITIHVFPNPSSSILYADKPFTLTSAPVVTDLNGFEYHVTSDWSTDKISINTGDLASGMYLIRLQGQSGSAVQKFTVMR